MQRALIKSSRSCRRGREWLGIPLSLRQSLSQIKVRFGARENNSVRSRTRIPRARPGLHSEYLFGEPDLSFAPSSLPVPPPPPLGYVCVSLGYRILYGNARPWTRTWDNPLENIKGCPNAPDSFAISTACGVMPFFDSLFS